MCKMNVIYRNQISNAQQSCVPATALCFFVFLMLKRLFFEPWNGMKNRWKMDQKSTKNQSNMDQKSIKNRPKSSIQNTPADAQPRIYKILLPTPSQAPLPTPSQGKYRIFAVFFALEKGGKRRKNSSNSTDCDFRPFLKFTGCDFRESEITAGEI